MGMKEHTITKTLFKLKHTYYRQSPRRGRMVDGCAGGPFPKGTHLCDGPITNFEGRLKKSNRSFFLFSSPVVWMSPPLSLLFLL